MEKDMDMKMVQKIDELKSQAFDAVCDILVEGGEIDVRMRGSSEQAVNKIQDIMCLIHNVDCTIDGLTEQSQ
jgi:hypothetical protein